MAETSFIDRFLDAIYGRDPNPTPQPAEIEIPRDSRGSVSRLSFFEDETSGKGHARTSTPDKTFTADVRPQVTDTLAPNNGPDQIIGEDDNISAAAEEKTGFDAVFIEYTGKPSTKYDAIERGVSPAAAPVIRSPFVWKRTIDLGSYRRTIDLRKYRKFASAPLPTPTVAGPKKPTLNLSRHRAATLTADE